jgi:hypothetical protein
LLVRLNSNPIVNIADLLDYLDLSNEYLQLYHNLN